MGEKGSAAAGKLWQGALMLGMAAAVSKLIGTLQKIPLQNIAGDAVFGIYNAVYPFYVLLLFLATAGFPVAVSKFVAERTAVGDEAGARTILRISAALLAALGIVFFAALYLGAEHVASWIGQRQTARAIQSASFALLLAPVMAALRGYFQGKQNMLPTAVSQLAEQTVRVATMVALLIHFTNIGASADWIAAGATFGSAAGAAGGLAVMIWYRIRDARGGISIAGANAAAEAARKEPLWTTVRRLVRYAIPVCLGAIAVPVIGIVDTFTVPRLLQHSGMAGLQALAEYGVYNRGLPLVQLVGMVVSSLSVTFVPAMAQAAQRGVQAAYTAQIHRTLRWFGLTGCAASIGLALLSEPINVMLYTNDAGTDAMTIVSFTAAASALTIVSSALLQAIGRAKTPVVHLLLATAVKIGLNVWLVPLWGINGAALAGVVAYVFAALLNTGALLRAAGIRPDFAADLGKPALALAVMAVAVWAAKLGTASLLAAIGVAGTRTAAAAVALTGVAVGVAAVGFVVIATRMMTERELLAVPLLRKLVPRAKRSADFR